MRGAGGKRRGGSSPPGATPWCGTGGGAAWAWQRPWLGRYREERDDATLAHSPLPPFSYSQLGPAAVYRFKLGHIDLFINFAKIYKASPGQVEASQKFGPQNKMFRPYLFIGFTFGQI